MKIIKFSSLYY